MVSPLGLNVFAALLLVLAAAVGRRTGGREALADGRAALAGTLSFLLASVALYATARGLAAPGLWRHAGSLALLASPVGAVLALRIRGHRSVTRALLGSYLALGVVVLWLTVNLRGPLAGWRVVDLALVLLAAAVALASAACLGWWSKRAPVATAVPPLDR